MAQITLETIVLTDVELTLGGTDDYAWHVSKVELVPVAPVNTWKGLSPSSVHQKVGSAVWTMNLDFAQDWKTAKSLSRYLFANHGVTVPFVFMPKVGTGLPSWSGNVTCVAGPVGGAIDSTAVGSVSLPVTGQPVPDYDDDPVTPNILP